MPMCLGGDLKALTKKEFDADRKGTGTMEWAETTYNISLGCFNDCLYCYAAHNANRFGLRSRANWPIEKLTKRADIHNYPARDGVVMFPSSHDITPFNLEAFVRVAKLMLAKGNKLLIVTKPRTSCVTAMIDEFQKYKSQILFRFTIGSMNDATTSFWEPGAPEPNERVYCLQLAQEAGYNTSVSIEPMLAGVESTMQVVETVFEYVTETIWVGRMNKPRLRVDMSLPENVAAVANIEKLQRDEEILRLVGLLQGNKQIRWKDSIKQVIDKGTVKQPTLIRNIRTAATFSPSRLWRYDLWRIWNDVDRFRYAMFIGLNPSTADETDDDPTVRRCIAYAKEWGFDALCMMNIFAYRATDPEVMKKVNDPVGAENDYYLLHNASQAGIVVAAWGVHGAHRRRGEVVAGMVSSLHVLKLTKDGHPAHPLYLKSDLKPIPWQR